MNKLFPDNERTYATYKNAKKVIDSLNIEGIEDKLRFTIGATEEGRFYPIIHVSKNDMSVINWHYFINKGCCVTSW